jgi:hypothetical protein
MSSCLFLTCNIRTAGWYYSTVKQSMRVLVYLHHVFTCCCQLLLTFWVSGDEMCVHCVVLGGIAGTTLAAGSTRTSSSRQVRVRLLLPFPYHTPCLHLHLRQPASPFLSRLLGLLGVGSLLRVRGLAEQKRIQEWMENWMNHDPHGMCWRISE